jgi:hypothetical protein
MPPRWRINGLQIYVADHGEPVPVLPLVASMTVCPGLNCPACSAASMTRAPGGPLPIWCSPLTTPESPDQAGRCVRDP